MPTYTHRFSSFLNGKVNPDRLTQEIQESAITIALDCISTVGLECFVSFKDVLTNNQQAILSEIVATHSGDPLESNTVQHVKLFADDTTPQPVAEDGKLYTLPNIFPGECVLTFCGASDSTKPFHGDPFLLQITGEGDISGWLQFVDGVYLAGGNIQWTGGSYGSNIAMELFAPASTVKAPAVENEGNCNLVPTGLGFNMIVPAAGDGTHDLDVAIPVPSFDNETNENTGHWENNEPWVGPGVTTVGVPGKSKFNLFDTQLEICHFVQLQLLKTEGCRDVVLHSIKPKWLMPSWKIKITLHNASANTLKVSWDLMVARRRSV